MVARITALTIVLIVLLAGTGSTQSFPPVLDPIGDTSRGENANLNFTVTASDADGTTPSLTTSTLPSTSTFTDNGDGTGVFDWDTDFNDAGTYQVTFYANDAVTADVDSETITITIFDRLNNPPTIDPIGPKSITEGVQLIFEVTGSDPEGYTLIWTATPLPGTATFTDHGNDTATFDWTPSFLDAGTYDVTFIADEGNKSDTEIVTITVNEAGNQLPVLDPIGAQSTTENVQLTFGVSATDLESTPTLTTSALPGAATFTDNGDGTGSFDWTPGFLESGSYNVTFYATDDSAAVDSEVVTITVNEAGNQLPVLDPIGAQSTTENVQLTFGVSASDVESTPALTTSALPGSATFTDNGDGTGSFDWTPGFLESGSYNVTFYATDDSAAVDSEVVTITVNEAGNQLPVLDPIGAQSTTENVQLTFGVSATDIESTPSLTTSALPGAATFTDNGDGTGSFDWTPGFLESGSYNVTFYATDDSAAVDSEVVTITVNEAGNQLPVLDPIGAQSTTENVQLTFGVSATDIESTPSLTTSALPGSATFTDNGDGTGNFDWTPSFTDAGSYDVTFYSTDDSAAVDSEVVTITVNEAGNQLPVLSNIGAQSTTENVQLTFGVSATDIESTPSLATSALPGSATFTDNGDGTGSFDWTPGFLESGSYNVTFYATDDSAAVDSEVVTITVNEAGNQPPVLDPIGPQSTDEGVLLTFGVSGSDIDGPAPSLTTSALPGTASFVDNGDGTGDFSWTPTFFDAGVYQVVFYADDGTAQDSEVVSITVDNINQTPTLDSIGDRSTDENTQLLFGVTGSDPDGTIPALTTSALPGTASFTDNGDGTGTFDWTPSFEDSGSYLVTFYATDDSAAVDSEQITITVTNVNRDPVLAAIGDRNTTENVNLNFAVVASDADGDTPQLTTSTLPGTASFTDNGDGTGTFDWTPSFADSGTYQVTFYAADGAFPASVDSETITITVTNENRDPVLSAIGARSTTENVLLSFGTSASDPDGDIPSMTSSALPTGASYIDNGNGTGSFSWTPTYVQSGAYDVTFYATDIVGAVDSETVTITVNDAGNQSPVLNTIGPKNTDENVLLSFTVTATDAESTPSLTTSALPSGASFVDNGDGSGDFSWTPDFTQSGTYNVTFFATDDSGSVHGEVVAITVNEVGNQLPVLANIGSQSTPENVQLTFGVSATDAESVAALTTSTLPQGAGFVDNGDGTGSFDWTPSFTQSGTYDITFYATDDSSAVDSEVVTITVTEPGNQAPNLATIGSQSTTENVLLSFGVSATDAESTPSLTTSTLPGTATFLDNGDGTGDFNWTPGYLESGTYNVTFYATDDSAAVDSEVVTITVNEAGNQLPNLANIGAQSTTENVQLAFGVSATDIESTPSLTTSALPGSATFVDNGDGTGTFDWTPGFLESGSYNVTFYATDDSAAVDSEVVTITVNEAGNQLPNLATIGAQSTTENVQLTFGVSATDIESTPILTTSTLPGTASFTDNGDGTGSFDWTPGFLESGTYDVTFYATDDSAAVDSEVVTITVNEAGNRLPVLDPIGAQSTTEGIQLTFGVSASDIESTPALTTSILPGTATFTDNGDGTGAFDWTPSFTDAGNYDVTFYATDDSAAVDSEVVTITVNDAGNQPPVLDPIGPKATDENLLLSFGVSASDADGTTPNLNTSALPGTSSFTDNGDGTGSFSWTPSYTDAGNYQVTFFADDGSASDSEIVTITVNEVGNQLPVLAGIGAQSTTEGALLTFGVSATDAESTPALTTSSLPLYASFTDNGDGTGTFDWTPEFVQAGTYEITLYATDDSAAVDSEQVTITVNEAGNQRPTLDPIGSKSVLEGDLLTFVVTATDPDSTAPALFRTTLPTGATFVDNGDGTGEFNWTPGFTQSESYVILFYASDGQFADSEFVTITVNEAGNQLPVLDPIGPQSTVEEVLLSFTVNSSDGEGVAPVLTTSTLPTGASFVDNGDGTGSFDWTPTFTQSGSYDVTFYATDDSLAVDSEVVTITVTEPGNQTPVLAAIGAQSTTENVLLSFGVTATDPEGGFPVLTTSTLPQGAGFLDNGDGTGDFNWTPTYVQSGTYQVTFYATDDSLAVDSEEVTITVIDAGNQPPVLATIGAQSTTENVLLTFSMSATDPEGAPPALSTSTLPQGANFVDNGNGTGDFDWTPNFLQSGTYQITFYATDDSLAVDSEEVTITVLEAGNQLPVLATIGPRSTSEDVQLLFGVSATDIESTPTLTTSALPGTATFTDNGDGTGTFDWTPGFLESGTYQVTFYATDDSAAVDSEEVTITVTEGGNQPPVLANIGPQSTTENVPLTFGASATDIESTPILTTSVLPGTATFTDNGDGTGSFDWTPSFLESGTYDVTFYATDDSAAVDSEVVTITVNDGGNQLPILSSIGAQSTTENVPLTFGVSATDIESTPALTTSSLPGTATFTDNGDGTGSFDWTPGYLESGIYQLTFYATDDSSAVDSEEVTITVIEAGNQQPTLAAIGAQSTPENVLLSFGVSATDIESVPSLTTSTLPAGASFVDNGDGTGDFDWTPTFVQAGSYQVTFYATDDSLAVDSEEVTITVIEAGNQPPVLDPIGPQSTTEDVLLTFTVTASDPDETIPALSAIQLPAGANFVDNGNGSGDFDWTPDFTQSGSFEVIFYADDGLAIDSEVVAITVGDQNRTPTADAGPDQFSVAVGSLITLDGTASFDPDGDPLNYSWVQVGGTGVILSDPNDSLPTFTPTLTDIYEFELTVDDGFLTSTPDTVAIEVVNVAPPVAVTDLSIQIVGDEIQLTWSPSTLDTFGFATTVDHYVIARDTMAYFVPDAMDSIGSTDDLTTFFADNNIGGVDVVGDTLVQYFYVVQVVDIFGNKSLVSNRVGEYDYQIITTTTTDFNLVGIPFTNTGITNADGLIAAIGSANVNTVNNYNVASQSYEARFAAGFGTNFTVVPGGVYQVNAKAATVFSVAGAVPDSGAISYSISTTTTTDFNFIMIPFEYEDDFSVAQDVLDANPGLFNTLNNYVAGSQSYQSRFSAGFGVNFPVKAGKPYQGNAAANGVFPGP